MNTRGLRHSSAVLLAACALLISGCSSQEEVGDVNEAKALAYSACTVPYAGPEPINRPGINPVAQLQATAALHKEASALAAEAAELDASWKPLAKAEATLAAANAVVAKMPKKVSDWTPRQEKAVAAANKSAQAAIKVVTAQCDRAAEGLPGRETNGTTA